MPADERVMNRTSAACPPTVALLLLIHTLSTEVDKRMQRRATKGSEDVVRVHLPPWPRECSNARCRGQRADIRRDHIARWPLCACRDSGPLTQAIAILAANSVSRRRTLPGTRSVWESPHQADVPTQEELSAQDARISRAHVESGRTAGAEGAAPQGAQALDTCERRVNRRHRLRGRGRFAVVRRTGAEARSGLVRVRSLAGRGDVARCGVAVVGARGAVERNRARRRARALLGNLLPELGGVDAIVWVQASAAGVAGDRLALDLTRALRGAALRCGHA